MSYPASLDSFTTKTNKVDLVDASHTNALQTAVVAIETAIGTNPQGSQTDLITRLALLMDSYGALVSGSSFPGSPVARQAFYRSDLDVWYIRNSANDTWVPQGGSLSNVVFCFGSGERVKYYTNTTTTPPAVPVNTIQMWGSDSSATYLTVLTTRFKKISGVNTLTLYIGMVSRNGGGTTKARLTLNSGATVSGDASSSAGAGVVNWVTTTVDVSGLSNGTVYDMNIDVYSDGTAGIGSTVGGIVFGS